MGNDKHVNWRPIPGPNGIREEDKPLPPVTVTLSGNSTPLLPTCPNCKHDTAYRCVVCGDDAITRELTSLRARLAEAEAKPGLPPEVLQAMEDFEQDMREKTIPEIIQETKRRERLAAEARQRLMGEVGTEQALHHAWRKRAEEAEARAGRAEEAVRVLAEYAAAKEACDGLRYRLDDDFKDEQTGEDRSVEYKDKGQRVYRARKAMNANHAARAAVEGAQ